MFQKIDFSYLGQTYRNRPSQRLNIKKRIPERFLKDRFIGPCHGVRANSRCEQQKVGSVRAFAQSDQTYYCLLYRCQLIVHANKEDVDKLRRLILVFASAHTTRYLSMRNCHLSILRCKHA